MMMGNKSGGVSVALLAAEKDPSLFLNFKNVYKKDENGCEMMINLM